MGLWLENAVRYASGRRSGNDGFCVAEDILHLRSLLVKVPIRALYNAEIVHLKVTDSELTSNFDRVPDRLAEVVDSDTYFGVSCRVLAGGHDFSGHGLHAS